MRENNKMGGCLHIRARFQRKQTIHDDTGIEKGSIVVRPGVKENASHIRRNRVQRFIQKAIKRKTGDGVSSTRYNSARTHNESREETWFDSVDMPLSNSDDDFETVNGDSLPSLSHSNQSTPRAPFSSIVERMENLALTDATACGEKGTLKELFSFKHGHVKEMEKEYQDDSSSSKGDAQDKVLQRSCLAGLLPSVSFNDRKLSVSPERSCLGGLLPSVSFNDRKLSVSPGSHKAKANLIRLSFKWRSFNERVDSSIPHHFVERPTAGSQIPFSAEYTEGSWCTIKPSPFTLRGPSYARDRKKVPASEYELYEPFGVDVFRSSKKINHIAEYVDIPSTGNIGKLPSLLVLNIQLPLYPTSIFLSNVDGEGLNLVSYYKLSENYLKVSPNFREMFLRILNDEAENVRGLTKDSNVPYRERLKILGRVENVEELQLSVAERKLIYAYNDKPVLSRPQHNFFQGENYIEIDLDVHRFSYIARKGVQTFVDKLKLCLLNFGLTIEGHKPEELPEHILCSVCINKIDFSKCKWIAAKSSREPSMSDHSQINTSN